MNNNRKMQQAAALVAPSHTNNGLRRYSAGSLVQLQLLGSPLAELSPEAAQNAGQDPYRLAEFCWLHSAPAEEVRRLVVNHRFNPAAVPSAVIVWAQELSVSQLLAMLPDIVQEAEQAEAAMAAVIPSGDGIKNGSGPSSPSASAAERLGQPG